MTDTQAIPLVFSFRQPIIGNGFIAGVDVDGRALFEEHEIEGGTTETWMTGITPVGIAGVGADRNAAYHDFRRAWFEVLVDFAVEASSFADFKAKCDEFNMSHVDHMTSLWKEAVDRVRREKYEDPHLPRDSADKPVRCEVVELIPVAARSDCNGVDEGAQVAA